MLGKHSDIEPTTTLQPQPRIKLGKDTSWERKERNKASMDRRKPLYLVRLEWPVFAQADRQE